MGRKINPFSFRLGIIEGWRSRWFATKKYAAFLKEDIVLRRFLVEKFRSFGLEKVEIERSTNKLTFIIFTSKPGFILGRGGDGVEKLIALLEKKYHRAFPDQKTKMIIRVQIESVLQAESNGQLVAQQVVEQIEKRIPFRRALKQSLDKIEQDKEVKGAKIRVSGRLDGGEIARTQWLGRGSMPLHTLRAHIDYGIAEAHCTYGIIGVKVWIYKGEVFK